VSTDYAVEPSGRPVPGTDNYSAGIGGEPLQVAALPYRGHSDGREVLLVTSRRSGRWILPKGWPQHGTSLSQSAAREAYEEAGVHGAIRQREIGRFVTTKVTLDGWESYLVVVYALAVEVELEVRPERLERQRQWFALAEAGDIIAPDQRDIIDAFHAAPAPAWD
jgi:8-oxo-dGTP pyrophosphatase MutT (NUDIX family)